MAAVKRPDGNWTASAKKPRLEYDGELADVDADSLFAVEEAQAALDAAREAVGLNEFDEPVRFKNGYRPKKVCNFFLEGRCTKGDKCSFAHGTEELHPDTMENGEATDLAEIAATQRRTPAKEVDQEVMLCGSSLEGPRDFPARQTPRQICQNWVFHPTACIAGDACPLAHGLAEMNMEYAALATILVGGTAAGATVTRGGGGGAEKAACGKAAVPCGKMAAPAYGKGGMWNSGKGKQFMGSGPVPVGPHHAAVMALPAPAFKGKGAASSWDASPYGKGKDSFPYCGKGKENWDAGKGKDGVKGGKVSLSQVAAAVGVSRFAHKGAKGGFMPTKMCQFWIKDPLSCAKGDACSYAHGVQELQPGSAEAEQVSRFHNKGFKPVKMCQFFINGDCTKGVACTFAHSPNEMA